MTTWHLAFTSRHTRVVACIALLSTVMLAASAANAVNLGGTDVPKDKLVVFLVIGHSNIQGAAEDLDVSIHPRVWNYHIPDAVSSFTGWEPAQDALHEPSSVYLGGGGPAMKVMKKLASMYPTHYVAALQNHNWTAAVRLDDGTNNRYWKPGGDNLYKEIIDAATSISADVTFGGIIAMIGFAEATDATYAATFSDDVTQMVTDMRADLGLPDLPFLIDREYESAPSRDTALPEWQTTQAERLLIPTKLPRSAIVDSDGPYRPIDGTHFNGAGMLAWGELAAEIIGRNGWFPETDPPAIVSASASGDPNIVRLVFSEYMDEATAETAANYAIDNGVTVSAASLEADGLTVALTVSTLLAGPTYTLTAWGVEDTPGNVIAAGSTIAFTYLSAVLLGRIGHWRFDENSGVSASDSSGSGNNGALVGPPSWIVPGRVGAAALELDASDRIEVPDFGPPVDLTVAAWIYPTGVWGVIAQKDGEYEVSVVDQGGAGRMSGQVGTTTLEGATVDLFDPSNINRWHHVAFTFDDAADSMTLYIDGAEVATTVTSESITDGSGPLWLGRHTGDFATFGGRIDDVRIYDRALTGVETASLAAAAPADAAPPSVVIASPANGATVNGMVSVAGTASDDVALAAVELQVDSGVNSLATGTTNWSYALDSSALSDGIHTLTVWATDTSANASNSSISISVDNSGPADTTDPSVAVSSPADGATVYGAVTVSGTATDNAGIFQVEIQLDGGAYAIAAGTTSWTHTLGTLSDGAHTITARATDSSGNTATHTISISVAQPSISILRPAGGEVWQVGSTQTIRWTTVTLDDVALFYSTDDGATWNSISPSISDSNPEWAAYSWVVPNEPSTRCMIRAQGYFAEAPTESGLFEITRASEPAATQPGGTVEGAGCACGAGTSDPMAGALLLLFGLMGLRRRGDRARPARTR